MPFYQGKKDFGEKFIADPTTWTTQTTKIALFFQMLKSLKKFKAQSVGVGTKFLKLGMIKGMEIDLPNLSVQASIVSKMDALREKTQRLEYIYQRKLAALEALKKSLLHQAFSGSL